MYNKQLCDIFTRGTGDSFIIFAQHPIKNIDFSDILTSEIHILISIIDAYGKKSFAPLTLISLYSQTCFQGPL